MLTSTINEVVLLVGKHLRPEHLTSDTPIVSLGLASLDLAQLVAELELRLGVDPFAIDVSVGDIVTVGDLYRAYERHAPVAR